MENTALLEALVKTAAAANDGYSATYNGIPATKQDGYNTDVFSSDTLPSRAGNLLGQSIVSGGLGYSATGAITPLQEFSRRGNQPSIGSVLFAGRNPDYLRFAPRSTMAVGDATAAAGSIPEDIKRGVASIFNPLGKTQARAEKIHDYAQNFDNDVAAGRARAAQAAARAAAEASNAASLANLNKTFLADIDAYTQNLVPMLKPEEAAKVQFDAAKHRFDVGKSQLAAPGRSAGPAEINTSPGNIFGEYMHNATVNTPPDAANIPIALNINKRKYQLAPQDAQDAVSMLVAHQGGGALPASHPLHPAFELMQQNAPEAEVQQALAKGLNDPKSVAVFRGLEDAERAYALSMKYPKLGAFLNILRSRPGRLGATVLSTAAPAAVSALSAGNRAIQKGWPVAPLPSNKQNAASRADANPLMQKRAASVASTALGGLDNIAALTGVGTMLGLSAYGAYKLLHKLKAAQSAPQYGTHAATSVKTLVDKIDNNTA